MKRGNILLLGLLGLGLYALSRKGTDKAESADKITKIAGPEISLELMTIAKNNVGSQESPPIFGQILKAFPKGATLSVQPEGVFVNPPYTNTDIEEGRVNSVWG